MIKTHEPKDVGMQGGLQEILRVLLKNCVINFKTLYFVFIE